MELTLSLFFNLLFFLTIIALSITLWRKAHEEKKETVQGKTNFTELTAISRGMAHEINNALTIIQGRATRLLRIHRNPEHHQDIALGLNQILYTSERIAKTVQGIRGITIEEDTEGDFFLTDLVSEVMVFFNQRMKNHGIEFHQRDVEGVRVFGNKIQLKQMILNLLSNAFDAVDHLEKKWIEISAIEQAERTYIYFEDSSVNDGEQNLDLPFAKKVAEEHGGTFSHHAERFHNTTYMVELPRSHAPS